MRWYAGVRAATAPVVVPERRLGLLALTAVVLFAAAVSAHESTSPASGPPVVLAPGYAALEFTAPAPGSYVLPTLGQAGDGAVLTSDGRRLRLSQLMADRLVVMAFVYTRCDDVNGCPLATFVLARIAERLAVEPRLAGTVRLLSLSFDVARDTPAVLAEYASHFRSPGSDWVFAVPDGEGELDRILASYSQSVLVDRDAEGHALGSFSHVLRVFLVDRRGALRNIYSTSFLHVDTVVNDLLTVVMDTAARPLAAGQILPRSGDVRDGYERADYQSRSSGLEARRGRPMDLVAGVDPPPLGLPPLPVPADNPLTPARVALGRKLFYDRRLSLNGTLSCAMCHVPEQGFTSNEIATAVGFGGRSVRRNSPTLYNTGYLERLFHDARELSLELQVWSPLLAANEMANPAIGRVIERLRELPDYAGLFESAFDGRGVDVQTVGMAIASYERTLVSGASAFDR